MDYVYAIISMLSGLGAFLIGFKLLSDNIEKLANGGIKKLFKKTGNNRFVGVGIGAAVTAIIQSSSASTVMVVGFVNAGLMTLFQATAMIMGANIGTTITAQVVALQAFDITKFAMLFSCIGIFTYMFSKKEKTKTIGMTLAGLGLVFLALDFMSSSMTVFKESQAIINVLASVDNPFLLLLIGIAFTALIQSSSATTTILITMVGAGISIGTNSNSILYVVLGSNIGTCVTALISSIGTTTNAKRASVIHLLFNVIGSLLFFIILLCWPSFMDMTFKSLFNAPATQIAMFHTFFNVLSTLLFLPFIKYFVKLACIIVPDKKKEEVISTLDERFLATPAIAISEVSKQVLNLGKNSISKLDQTIEAFIAKDVFKANELKKELEFTDGATNSILSYLVKISSSGISFTDEEYVAKLHNVIGDFGRLDEIADNMVKYTNRTVEGNLEFSTDAYDKIRNLKNLLDLQFSYVEELFSNSNKDILTKVDDIENEIDKQRSQMLHEHIARLEKNECSPSNSAVYINLVSNLERAGDHLNTVAHSICSK